MTALFTLKKSWLRHSGLSLSLLLMLSACANVGKQPSLDHTLDVTQLQLDQGQTVAVQAKWWEQLQQPTLSQLMDSALAHAPDLRMAEARLKQAEAQWRGVTGQGGVQVNLTGNGAGMYLNPKPDTSFTDQKANHVFSTEIAGLGIGYNFDFWGKQRHLIQAALGQRQAAQYQQLQAQLILAQSIVAQYTQWQLAEEQKAVLARRIEINQQILALLSRRIHAGLQPASDAFVPEQTLLSLQSAEYQARASIDNARNSLAALTGQSPTVLAQLKPQKFGLVPVVSVEGLHADILGQRPDIAVQRALLQSRYYGVKAAKAEFYPNVKIEALAGLTHLNIFDLIHSSARLLQVLPAVSLPVFTSGQLQANLVGKRAEYNEQVAQYDKTVLTALQQAADAISAYQQSSRALPLQEQSWSVAQHHSQVSAQRQKAGLDNGLTYLQRADSALAVQMDYLKMAAWHQQSWSDLQAALGGGIEIKKLNLNFKSNTFND